RLGKRLGARCSRRLFCVTRTLRIEKIRRPGGTRGLLRRGGCRRQPERRSILEMGRVEITTLERVDGTISRWRAATKPGEIFRQPNLARTWRELGKHGRELFYEGEFAQKIVGTSDAGGGYLTASDL